VLFVEALSISILQIRIPHSQTLTVYQCNFIVRSYLSFSVFSLVSASIRARLYLLLRDLSNLRFWITMILFLSDILIFVRFDFLGMREKEFEKSAANDFRSR